MQLPMVGGLAYRERLEQLPSSFTATLEVEPDSSYNPRAIAVVGPSGKVGYVPPEAARELYDRVAGGEVASCLVKRGHDSPTTGVLGRLEI